MEPFAGGAGAGLSLLATGQVSRVVINDLDPAVFAFWRLLTEDPDYLIQETKSVPLTVKEWRHQKEIYKRAEPNDIRAMGFATFYLNRTNRSGILNGGPIGGLEQKGPYKIDARFNREKLVERITLLRLFAPSISVSSRDGTEVIDEFSRVDDAFIYADPPYFRKAGSLYMNSFRAEDHRKLAATLNRAAGCPWLLTYDDVPEVHELYSERRRVRFDLQYSANGACRATEVAVLSDAMADIEVGWPVAMKKRGRS